MRVPCVHGGHAVIVLSLPRRNQSFEGLALDGELAKRGRSSAMWTDRNQSGDRRDIGMATFFTHTIEELYDCRRTVGRRASASHRPSRR